MIQKQYRAANFEEFEGNLKAISGLDEYRNANCVLVQLFIECWDEQLIRKAAAMAGDILDKAVVTGMTNLNHEIYDFAEENRYSLYELGSIDIDLICLESSSVSVEVYEKRDCCELVAGGQAGLYLSTAVDVKAAGVFVAGSDVLVEDFLIMAAAENSGIPFYGGKAGARYCDKRRNKLLYIFHGDQIVKEGIMVIYWHGEELHVRTGYNFGWTPIGKKMTVTKMTGELKVQEIDNRPATFVYRKYLGLKPQQLTIENVCEFPFCVKRGERLIARIGLASDDPDEMMFSAPMFEGDEIQLTYGNPDVLFAESFADAMEVMRFEPQAVMLIACVNRNALLKKAVKAEQDFYRRTQPQLMMLHGDSEILFDEDGGGELNSALVSVAMREGEKEGKEPWFNGTDTKVCPYTPKSIPLVRRMTTFLGATTRDLAEAVENANLANQAKSQFLSGVSHEIRTPINAVLGMDEMILRESSEPQIRRYAMDIQNSGRMLLSLINDLLDSSRIDSGKMEIIPVEYELSSMLNDLVSMTSVRANEKDLKFNVNVSSDIPHVLTGDDTRIRQCVLNILTNAIKYTETGSVTMDVGFEKKDENHINLSFAVTDTGIGIKKEDIDRLFAPYERIEERRNRSIEGTGLGMNIVLSLLSMMGSKLNVESEYGKGSVFSFVIAQEVKDWEPVGDFAGMYRRSVDNLRNYHESFHAPEARLLVVDDTRMNLTVFSGLLKPTQVRVDTAENGAQALSLVKKFAYDIIFLDQRMPGMDGIETLRRMKHMYDSKNHGVPVIMLTANAVSGAREMFLNEGFDDYLTKPINGKKLERVILERLPEEKIIIPETEEQKNDREIHTEFSSPFLKALSKTGMLSVEEGLNNCMNEDILRTTLSDFVTGAKDGPEIIQEYLDSNDIENYTIRVHSLKSSSRIIGAKQLSEQARILEEFGDAYDLEKIKKNTPKLLEDYRRLADGLAEVLAEKNVSETAVEKPSQNEKKPAIKESELKAAMDGVRDFIMAFDYDSAADIISMLEEYDLPEQARKLLEIISDHITKLERDELLEKLS